MRMKEIVEENDMDQLKIGDCFLYGNHVIGQKQSKIIGQSLSYFKIISKSKNGVEYAPIFDHMEKDIVQGEKKKK